uniref:Uncharacterized protein n=1 Tax=Anguilla anguilla TaxID=7936 RepID=A0A0E9XQE2_ANGAN
MTLLIQLDRLLNVMKF